MNCETWIWLIQSYTLYWLPKYLFFKSLLHSNSRKEINKEIDFRYSALCENDGHQDWRYFIGFNHEEQLIIISFELRNVIDAAKLYQGDYLISGLKTQRTDDLLRRPTEKNRHKKILFVSLSNYGTPNDQQPSTTQLAIARFLQLKLTVPRRSNPWI